MERIMRCASLVVASDGAASPSCERDSERRES